MTEMGPPPCDRAESLLFFSTTPATANERPEKTIPVPILWRSGNPFYDLYGKEALSTGQFPPATPRPAKGFNAKGSFKFSRRVEEDSIFDDLFGGFGFEGKTLVFGGGYIEKLAKPTNVQSPKPTNPYVETLAKPTKVQSPKPTNPYFEKLAKPTNVQSPRATNTQSPKPTNTPQKSPKGYGVSGGRKAAAVEN
ncbi:hypothetical protein RHSIM_Rhsim12G0055500 [Rhododendron simsii]|uniref:Uncharacterized protein n=1 Tax=Rhododendron simsii TaxID=118357 RepID=A0A834L9Q3_RHOSS|nr:hypothetical protein RHSIM_Rhsim12G0055500 [Rhododendron simsii]